MSVEAGARLVQAMAAQQSPTSGSFRIGLIQMAGQGVLRIFCDGLVLEPQDLWLVPPMSFKWEEDNGSAHYLRSGDRVVLLTQDFDDFYVIAKVVHA